jgi:hypothetical protein
MRRLRGWMANVLLMLVSTGVTLLIFEAGLRLFLYGHLAAADFNNVQEMIKRDDILGWRYHPNLRAHVTGLDFNVAVATNSRGLRDDEHEYDPAPGVFRIVLLGDSFMDAYQVPLERSVSKLLEHELGPGVEVINLGVRGYSPLQSYLALREIGLRYKPDLVLFACYPLNDVPDMSPELKAAFAGADSWRTVSRPYLEVSAFDASYAFQQPDSEASQQAIDVDLERMRKWRAVIAKQPFYKRSLTWQYISNRWDARDHPGRIPPRDPNALYGVLATRFNPSLADFPRYTAGEYQALHTNAWKRTTVALQLMNKLARASGAQFAFFIIPDKYQVDPVYRDRIEAAFPGMALDPALASRQLASIARESDLSSLDLLPLFRDHYEAGGPALYHRIHDTHWNERGHARATQAIAEFLAAEGLVSSN